MVLFEWGVNHVHLISHCPSDCHFGALERVYSNYGGKGER